MEKKLKIAILIIFTIFFTLLIAISSEIQAGTLISNQMQSGLVNAGKEIGYGETPPKTFVQAIGGMINILLTFLGIFFLVFIVYAGFLWMTAGGNEEKIKKAKSIMTTSFIGMVIILTARIISEFIIRGLG